MYTSSEPRPHRSAVVTHVWAVHAVLADEVRPTQALFADEGRALGYAAQVSNDDEVLAASVVRFVLDELGTRRNLAMFVNGQRQGVPHLSDCGRIHGGGRNPHG
jgi:hypothetical protein